jgi:hypothetical protein
METLQNAIQAAQSLAESAIELAQFSGSGGGSNMVTRSFYVSFASDAWDTQAWAHTTTSDVVYMYAVTGEENLLSTDSGGYYTSTVHDTLPAGVTDTPFTLGDTFEESLKVQLYRNGVLQHRMYSVATPFRQGTWAWAGHLWFMVHPPLQEDERITIVAPQALNWHNPNISVTYSWRCAGFLDSELSGINIVHRLDWATHMLSTESNTMNASHLGGDGAGGTSDQTYGRIFGGRVNTSGVWHVSRMTISTRSWSFYFNKMLSQGSRIASSTSGTNTYVYGVGASLNQIAKHEHSSETYSTLLSSITGMTNYGKAASDANLTFGYYMAGASNGFTKTKHKLTYASESYSSDSTGDKDYANDYRHLGIVTFNDNKGIFMKAASGGHGTVWVDWATDAHTNLGYSLSSTTGHTLNGDGVAYALSRDIKLHYTALTKITESIPYTSYLSRSADPTSSQRSYSYAGCFSDNWLACQ